MKVLKPLNCTFKWMNADYILKQLPKQTNNQGETLPKATQEESDTSQDTPLWRVMLSVLFALESSWGASETRIPGLSQEASGAVTCGLAA